jgi:hypothetical protein
MDRLAFEARLKAEGWPEIRENQLEPHRHNHPAGVRYLVGRRPRP